MARLPELDPPQLLLLGVIVALVLAVGAAATTSASAFGAYNPSWEGASDLRGAMSEAGVEATVAAETTRYDETDPGSTVAVVLSPDRPYAANDTERLRRFVRAGGTLVVAEDFGPHANPLLADLGVRTRVDGRLLRDERRHYRSPNITVAPNVSDHPLVAGVDRLTLNHGSALRPNGARAVVNSSSYAYLDGNRNAELDDDEEMRARPVVTVERVGEGRVVVVSDPSLFINAMLDRPGNGEFVSALAAGHDRAILDYSHARSIPPLAAAVLALRANPWLQAVVGLAGVVGVAVAARRTDEIRSGLRRAGSGGATGRDVEESVDRPDPERLARAIRRRHPDWSDDRIRRIIAEVIYVQERRDRDD